MPYGNLEWAIKSKGWLQNFEDVKILSVCAFQSTDSSNGLENSLFTCMIGNVLHFHLKRNLNLT